MLFNNSVRTSKRTPHFTITNINWLMLFKEIIVFYNENQSKAQIQNTAFEIIKIAGTYYALKGSTEICSVVLDVEVERLTPACRRPAILTCFSSVPLGRCRDRGHGSFLSFIFQFIIHKSFYHLALYKLCYC